MTGIELVFLTGALMVFLMSAVYMTGWNNIKEYHPEGKKLITPVTVVIAARNEEYSIYACLKKISAQDFPPELMEVMVVDDNSEDKTAEEVLRFMRENKLPVKLIDLKSEAKESKKQAVDFAVRQAKGELIITTDADCLMGPGWVKTITAFYEEFHPDFISGPVTFHPSKNIFKNMQALEFSGLIGSGAAFIGLGIPIMCNGANLAYPKKIFLDSGGFDKNRHLASGDDMLLMNEIAKQGGKISFLKSRDAIVFTSAMDNFSGFINQRIRWASKNYRVLNIPVILISALVFFPNFLVLAGLLLCLFHPAFSVVYLSFLIFKCLADAWVLSRFLSFFKKKELLYLLLPTQFFVAIYSFLVLILSAF